MGRNGGGWGFSDLPVSGATTLCVCVAGVGDAEGDAGFREVHGDMCFTSLTCSVKGGSLINVLSSDSSPGCCGEGMSTPEKVTSGQ